MSKKKTNIKMESTVETVVTPMVEAVITTKKPGRPICEGSDRQARLAARAERIAAGGSVKRGRPSNEGSKRQIKLAAQAVKVAQGFEIKPGRPKMIKAEVAEVV